MRSEVPTSFKSSYPTPSSACLPSTRPPASARPLVILNCALSTPRLPYLPCLHLDCPPPSLCSSTSSPDHLVRASSAPFCQSTHPPNCHVYTPSTSIHSSTRPPICPTALFAPLPLPSASPLVRRAAVSASLLPCPPVRLSVELSFLRPFCPVYLSTCLPVRLFVKLPCLCSFCPIHLSACPPVCLTASSTPLLPPSASLPVLQTAMSAPPPGSSIVCVASAPSAPRPPCLLRLCETLASIRCPI